MRVRTIKNTDEFKVYNPKRTRPEHRRRVLIKTMHSDDEKDAYYDADNDCFHCLRSGMVYYSYNRIDIKYWRVKNNSITYFRKYDKEGN